MCGARACSLCSFLVNRESLCSHCFCLKRRARNRLRSPFYLSSDPGDTIAQLPCWALIVVALKKRSDIASSCIIHQDTRGCKNGDKLTEHSRFVEFAWESVTEAFRDKTCLRSPIASWFTPSGVSNGDVFRTTRPDARFRAEAAAAMSRLRPC